MEIPRGVVVSVSAVLGLFLLLCANEIFGNPPLTTPDLRPGTELVGTWSSGDKTLTIRSDGTVTGTIVGTIRYNRTWFGKLMHWRTDYIIQAHGPFDLRDSEFARNGPPLSPHTMREMNRVCAILCLAGVFSWASDDAQSALNAAQTSLAAGDYAHALEQAEQAAGLFRSRHDPTGEKLALDIAGSAYLYRGDYDLALERYQTALQIDRRQQDASGEITRLCNIGSVYFFRGRYSEALAQYVQALKRVSETGASGQLVFTNLATLYQQLGDNQKALDYYQQALLLGPNGDLLTNAGSLYRRVGNVAKSLESYHAAQTFYAQEHRAGAEVHVLEEIGVLQGTDLHDLNGAVASFTQALTLAPARDQAIAHLFRGEALYRMGRQDAAAEGFRAAGDNWLALYRLGDIARAVSIRDTPLPPGFFPAKRDLYAAAIRQLLHAGNPDPQRIFALLERVHDSPVEAPPLSAIQARLCSRARCWSNTGPPRRDCRPLGHQGSRGHHHRCRNPSIGEHPAPHRRRWCTAARAIGGQLPALCFPAGPR